MSTFQSDLEAADLRMRIDKAMEFVADGAFDGAHHKMWAIDQILRALTACPSVTVTARDVNNKEFTYETQGESDEYLAWVAEFRGDWDEEEQCYEYDWDTGIAP